MYFTVLLMLTGFAVVSLGMWLSGEKVCECFGFLSVSPVLSMFFDICGIAALIGSRVHLRLFYVDSLWLSLPALIASVCAIAYSGLAAHMEHSEPSYRDYAKKEWNVPRNPDESLLSIVRPLVGSSRELKSLVDAAIDGIVELNEVLVPSGCRVDVIEPEDVVPLARNRAFVLVRNSYGSYRLIIGMQHADGVWCFELLKGHQSPYVWPVEDLMRDVTGAWVVNCDEVSRPGLIPMENLVRFGIIAFGADVERAVVFRNNSNSMINILHVRTSCSCIQARFAENRTYVHPGESVELIINLDSIKSGFRHAAEVVYEDLDRNKEVAIRLDLVGSQVCKGEVVPSRLDFGLCSDVTSRTIRVSESMLSRFTISRIEVGDLPIECTLTQKLQTNDLLKDYLISCKIKPAGVARGSYVGAIKVFTSISNPSFWEIPVNFEVKEE